MTRMSSRPLSRRPLWPRRIPSMLDHLGPVMATHPVLRSRHGLRPHRGRRSAGRLGHSRRHARHRKRSWIHSRTDLTGSRRMWECRGLWPIGQILRQLNRLTWPTVGLSPVTARGKELLERSLLGVARQNPWTEQSQLGRTKLRMERSLLGLMPCELTSRRGDEPITKNRQQGASMRRDDPTISTLLWSTLRM